MAGQGYRGFAERVALVTGGAQGIGRAVALQLALEGAYVVVSYASAEAGAETVVKELRELGTLAHSIEADASRAEGVGRIFAEVEALYGRLDMLVNYARLTRAAAPLEELTEEAWNEAVNAGLKSAFLCSQAAVRLMRQRPSPSIVQLAPQAAAGGAEESVQLAVAEAGMIGLTGALARELSPRIRVNCVTVSPQAQPDEAARACVYLLSPEARSITGQVLTVGARLPLSA
ncbi:MAG TPA: SDR family oxidoreductase [Pyrinomonadaceae bacterium]|jgi:3-oxoacyl-[acyl-carrier protein] reductase